MQALRWLITVLGSIGLAASSAWLIHDPGPSSLLAMAVALGFAGTVLLLIEASRATRPRPRGPIRASGAMEVPLWERSPPSRPRIAALSTEALRAAEPVESRDLFRSVGWLVVMFAGFVFFLCLLLTLQVWPRHAALPGEPSIQVAEQPPPPPPVDEKARRRFRQRLK